MSIEYGSSERFARRHRRLLSWTPVERCDRCYPSSGSDDSNQPIQRIKLRPCDVCCLDFILSKSQFKRCLLHDLSLLQACTFGCRLFLFPTPTALHAEEMCDGNTGRSGMKKNTFSHQWIHHVFVRQPPPCRRS